MSFAGHTMLILLITIAKLIAHDLDATPLPALRATLSHPKGIPCGHKGEG
jgi:uncharacterized membrane protein YczE